MFSRVSGSMSLQNILKLETSQIYFKYINIISLILYNTTVRKIHDYRLTKWRELFMFKLSSPNPESPSSPDGGGNAPEQQAVKAAAVEEKKPQPLREGRTERWRRPLCALSALTWAKTCAKSAFISVRLQPAVRERGNIRDFININPTLNSL